MKNCRRIIFLLLFSFSFIFSGPLEKELMEASKKCESAKVMRLIRKGADIRARDHNGLTALHYAAQINCVSVARILLRRGMDPDVPVLAGGPFADKTPLDTLEEFHKEEDISPERALLAYLAVGTKQTPLHWSAIFDHFEVSSLLINYGANVNAKDTAEKTPLHYAALSKGKKVARLLLARGAQVNARDKFGNTPLHDAVVVGNKEAAALLISKRANVNEKNSSLGYTPLHLAAFLCRKELAELLIVNKADVNALSNDNCTPLDLALRNLEIEKYKYSLHPRSCSDVVALLQSRGAVRGKCATKK